MNNKALLATTALILALSAVSCGKEDSESSVSIAYGESTRTTVTEESEQEKTTGKTTKAVSVTGTATATTTSAVSGTETTTTDSGEETSTEATTSAENSDTTATTATVADTTIRAETTAPSATTVATTAEATTESTEPAQEENNNNTGNDDNNNNNDDNNNDDNNNDTPPAITLAPDNPEPATATRQEENIFEFEFTVDNLLNDASGLLGMLGTPSYSGEAPGCTSNGNDVKIYQYDGIEIQCYIDGATEYIFSIEITDNKYVTDKGIKTGSSRAEVESAYGTGETSGSMTVYYTGNNEMDIEYINDTVSSIFFYAPV
ncbi:MAG: hypothetical protein HDT23_06945 [Ruminococcus sp.]|nr:hypothetical protein [Ruminococcus sp.]